MFGDFFLEFQEFLEIFFCKSSKTIGTFWKCWYFLWLRLFKTGAPLLTKVLNCHHRGDKKTWLANGERNHRVNLLNKVHKLAKIKTVGKDRTTKISENPIIRLLNFRQRERLHCSLNIAKLFRIWQWIQVTKVNQYFAVAFINYG